MQKNANYRSPTTTYGLAALIATLVIGIALYLWLDWNLYWVWMIVVNLVTFAFYRLDKRRAGHEGVMRIPELVLLGLLVVGGVIGGAAGMFMRPRHKTRKPLFWIVLIASTALHIYLFYIWILI